MILLKLIEKTIDNSNNDDNESFVKTFLSLDTTTSARKRNSQLRDLLHRPSRACRAKKVRTGCS